MSTRILVVDDDPGISEMVAILLESEGYDVTVCANGSNVVALYRAERPDLVLLDVMLPGLDGVTVCKHLREESDVPIIMMSARTDSLDVIAGLEAGADDYVTKPFENSVLLARVKARLRRQEPESEMLRVADLTVDLKGHQVLRDGQGPATHPAGVRSPGRSGAQAVAGVLARGAAGAGVGIPPQFRGHPPGQRPHPATAFQGGEGPGSPRGGSHHPRRWLPGRSRTRIAVRHSRPVGE